MSKRISVTFKIGDEECNTVEMPEFGPNSLYKDELTSYKSGYIEYGDKQLRFSISIPMMKNVIKELDLATKEDIE